jgi:hypothetical protein
MIPPDYSIDDELPLFTVNFNGRKIAKIRTRPLRAHPQNNWCYPSPGKKTQGPSVGSEDLRIRSSRTQNRRYQALGEVTASRDLG